MPLVSVVIPIFRYDWEFALAIESVLRQSFTEFEIIVVDNNATPAARKVAQEYASSHPQKVRVIHEPKQGNASARNRGITEAKAPLVAFLDSDDLMASTRLARQVQSLLDHPEAVFTYSAISYCSHDGAVLTEKHRRPRIPAWADILHIPFCDPDQTSMMFRKDAAIAIGLFDERLNPFWLEDTDFSFRMFRVGPFAYIDEPLTTMRSHSDAELSWRDRNAYPWHSLKNATLFFEKVRDAYYQPADPANHRRFMRARADWLRGSAKILFRAASGAEYGRMMLAAALRSDPTDWQNWKQFARSRLPYPLCAKLLKVVPDNPGSRIGLTVALSKAHSVSGK